MKKEIKTTIYICDACDLEIVGQSKVNQVNINKINFNLKT